MIQEKFANVGMDILDGHANSRTIVKNLNPDVSTMGTAQIVVVFVIVLIISMVLFAKIKMPVSACHVKRIRHVFYTRIRQKDIAVKTQITHATTMSFTLFC